MFIEQNCCIKHEGNKYCAGGAVVTNDYIVAYIGEPTGETIGCGQPTGRRELQDWHGNRIGTCSFSSSWPINSYISDRMYQVYATVKGITYTGRSCGEGMVFKGKRCAKQ